MTLALQGFGLKPAIGQMLAEMLPCGSGGWGCLVYANPSNSCWDILFKMLKKKGLKVALEEK